MSIFLVEVADATWQCAGFAGVSEESTICHCEPFLCQRHGWPADPVQQILLAPVPAVTNRDWSFDNLVLMDDSLRTAHFSIGSSMRLAMEDAIALWLALGDSGRLPAAPALYRERHLPPIMNVLDAVDARIRWYQRMGELICLSPVDFAYSYMTRTGRVDHSEAARCDPKLAVAWERSHSEIFGDSY